MHGSSAYEVIDEAIGPADAGVSDAGEAAGDAGECGPDDGVGVPVVVYIYFHVYFDAGPLHFELS